jgi:acetoin utilization deacetylase AcuC-like enzyme
MAAESISPPTSSNARRTGLVHHPVFAAHDTGHGHPERPARLAAVLARLESSGLLAQVDRFTPDPAPVAWLMAVHDEDYVERVERACASGVRVLDFGDTVVSEDSWQAALVAAGGAVQAVDKVMDGVWANAFVACRPPGHHAEVSEAMGFCLFNNVAVAAAHLRRVRGVERVAILDWDVHHGNGTQHAFESDPTVFYASLHQWPWYPGTGAADERGVGAGEGATLNCPMAAGTGDGEWLSAIESKVLPALERFDPGFILISAGFDAHEQDPLSHTRVTTDGFRRMTRLVKVLAEARCGGRVVSLLEGGYDLDALASSVEGHVGELLERPR